MKNRFEKITDDEFIKTFNESISVEDIKRKLNLPINGSSGRFVNNKIKLLGLDKSVLKMNYKNKFFIHKVCPVCRKEFWVPRAGRSKNQITCSYKCSNTYFRSGENNGMYGKTIQNGGDNYRTICFLHHPHKCCVCGEENIVAVHHIDGNHKNNDILNLVPLCPTHHNYCHSRFKSFIQDKINEYMKKFKIDLYNKGELPKGS